METKNNWVEVIIDLENKKEKDLKEAAPPLKAEAVPVVHGQ
jgi:hypothetical protein